MFKYKSKYNNYNLCLLNNEWIGLMSDIVYFQNSYDITNIYINGLTTNHKLIINTANINSSYVEFQGNKSIFNNIVNTSSTLITINTNIDSTNHIQFFPNKKTDLYLTKNSCNSNNYCLNETEINLINSTNVLIIGGIKVIIL